LVVITPPTSLGTGPADEGGSSSIRARVGQDPVADQVGFGDDAEEIAVVVHHGQRGVAVGREQAGRLLRRCCGMNGHDRAGHQVRGAHRRPSVVSSLSSLRSAGPVIQGRKARSHGTPPRTDHGPGVRAAEWNPPDVTPMAFEARGIVVATAGLAT
jgi:hypothetical protein